MSIALLLEVFYHNCDDHKIFFLINSIDNNLFDPEEFPIPVTLKSKIVPKAGATQSRRKLLTLTDCGSNIIFGCPAFLHAFPGMRMNQNGHQKERRFCSGD